MTYEATTNCENTAFPALVHVPGSTLITLFAFLYDSRGPHSIWSDTRPGYGYWAFM
jgi:hypothetical protein